MTTVTITSGGLDTGDAAATARQERLAERVSEVRRRRALVLSDRWMLVVGGTMLPLGLVLVLLGWQGAANTPLVFEQVPYLISGGVLGLALVVSGGFVYFGYWLTLLVRENREGRVALAAALGRMETLLSDATLAAPRGPRSAPAAPIADLVATRTGTLLHRRDCVAVDGKSDLRAVTAATPGLTPCKLCDPLG